MRKWVKRIASALTACVATCAFYGCMDVSKYYYTYDYETYKTQAVSVELMDYIPEKVEYGSKRKGKYEVFETDKATLVETLPQEEIQDFLYEFSLATVNAYLQENTTSRLSNPCGRIVRITYADGSFHTLSYCEDSYQMNGDDYVCQIEAFTYYNANGAVVESRILDGYDWYIFVVSNYFSEKMYPLECDIGVKYVI